MPPRHSGAPEAVRPSDGRSVDRDATTEFGIPDLTADDDRDGAGSVGQQVPDEIDEQEWTAHAARRTGRYDVRRGRGRANCGRYRAGRAGAASTRRPPRPPGPTATSSVAGSR